MAARIYGHNDPRHVDDEEEARLDAERDEDSLDADDALRRNGRIRGEKNDEKDKGKEKDEKSEEENGKEEKSGTSLGHKVAFAGAVTVLGATAVSTGIAYGTKRYQERVGNDISEAVGQIIMDGASPIDRRLPAIGAPKPSRKEREQGYEFDH